MKMRQRDRAGGIVAAMVIGIIFGAIGALALVWLLSGARSAGVGG